MGKCKYHFRCGECKKNHHSLLHLEEEAGPGPLVLLSGDSAKNVLIPTARVKLLVKDGREVHVKCILDSGSQVSIITSKAIGVLGLTPERNDINLIGVTEAKTKSDIVSHCRFTL